MSDYTGVWSQLPAGVSPAAYAQQQGVSPNLMGAFLQSAYTSQGATPEEVVNRFKNPTAYMTPQEKAADLQAQQSWNPVYNRIANNGQLDPNWSMPAGGPTGLPSMGPRDALPGSGSSATPVDWDALRKATPMPLPAPSSTGSGLGGLGGLPNLYSSPPLTTTPPATQNSTPSSTYDPNLANNFGGSNGSPPLSTTGNGGTMYAGGSPTFNERTGQYSPKQGLSNMGATRYSNAPNFYRSAGWNTRWGQ